MNLKTFKAPTMGEALTQVKTAMGSDAIILPTRTIQTRRWLGLRRAEMVEITAGKGLNIGPRSPRRPPAAEPRPPTAAYSRAGPAPRNAVEGSRQIMETPAANSAAILC